MITSPIGLQRFARTLRLHPRQQRQLRRQHPRADDDRLVDLVAAGERHQSGTVRLAQARSSSTSGARASATSSDDGLPVSSTRCGCARSGSALDDDRWHSRSRRARRPADGRSAVAADDEERVDQAAHARFETMPGDRRPERRLPCQAEDRAQHVGPADDRQVDAEGHPQPLRIGKRVGDLAEADGGGRVGHHVEGVEQAHPPGPAFRVGAGISTSRRWRSRRPAPTIRLGMILRRCGRGSVAGWIVGLRDRHLRPGADAGRRPGRPAPGG